MEDVGGGVVLGRGRFGDVRRLGRPLPAALRPRWLAAARRRPAGGRRTVAGQGPCRRAHHERGPGAVHRRGVLGLLAGEAVAHPRFGAGVVTHVEGEGEEARAEVRFVEGRSRRFILHLTPLAGLSAVPPVRRAASSQQGTVVLLFRISYWRVWMSVKLREKKPFSYGENSEIGLAGREHDVGASRGAAPKAAEAATVLEPSSR